jgi:4-hydroxy-tetrahydrodipicolinate synthase
MFSGSIPALVTPFTDGLFDEAAFRRLVDWQIDSGSSALAPCGTTGENSTLFDIEQQRVIEVCVEQSAGRVPVIAGCGTNHTMTTLLHMDCAAKAGAAAALVVAPYYSRPSQEGLLAHFSYLAKHSNLPIMLYNVPARTGSDLSPAIVCELARRFPDTFVGIKDASGDIARVSDHRTKIGNPFCQLSGDDKQALAFNATGGVGCISVTANVAPVLCAQFQKACAANDLEAARKLNDILYPLHCAMFADSSPGPCKYALSRVLRGFPDALRLPLVPCSDEARWIVDAALLGAGLI